MPASLRAPSLCDVNRTLEAQGWSCHCPCLPGSLARLPGGSEGFTSRSCWHLCWVLAQGLLMGHVVGVPTRVASCPRPIDDCSLSNYFYLSVVFFPLLWLLPLVLCVCRDLTTSWLGGSRLMDMVLPYEEDTKLQDQL